MREYKEADIVAPWLKRGIKNVRMLHTHDPKVADTEAFAAVLRTANAVWFNGGRQWNIVDSYMNTLTYKEFHNVLARGGVIGGSSAGATIQGDYLVRGSGRRPADHDDAREGARARLQLPAPHGHRPAHQHAEPLGRPHSRHPEDAGACWASASRRAPPLS